MTRRRTAAVDWDGTCVEDAWPAQGDWLPGAIPVLHELARSGWRILIHTCRIAPVEPDGFTERRPGQVMEEINGIREKLDEAGLTMVEIHTKPWKPSADVYIDNKAVRYAGRPHSWANLLTKLRAIQELAA